MTTGKRPPSLYASEPLKSSDDIVYLPAPSFFGDRSHCAVSLVEVRAACAALQPHRQAVVGEVALDLGDAVLAEMEDARRQHGVAAAVGQRLAHVRRSARA